MNQSYPAKANGITRILNRLLILTFPAYAGLALFIALSLMDFSLNEKTVPLLLAFAFGLVVFSPFIILMHSPVIILYLKMRRMSIRIAEEGLYYGSSRLMRREIKFFPWESVKALRQGYFAMKSRGFTVHYSAYEIDLGDASVRFREFLGYWKAADRHDYTESRGSSRGFFKLDNYGPELSPEETRELTLRIENKTGLSFQPGGFPL